MFDEGNEQDVIVATKEAYKSRQRGSKTFNKPISASATGKWRFAFTQLCCATHGLRATYQPGHRAIYDAKLRGGFIGTRTHLLRVLLACPAK